MKGPWWRTWLVNAGIVSLAVVLGLAVAEGVVRWRFPQPTGLSHQDRYGLAMHWPGITRSLPQFGHTVTHNADGMRDRAWSRAKAPGTFRILLTGDSFMEAYQVPFDSATPARLEGALQQAGKRVEVMNAGVSGWGTDDQLRYYMRYAREFRPDLVVVAMTLHNDISDNMRRAWHVERDGGLVERDRPPMPWLDYQKVRLKGYVATRFQLYQLWRKVRHRGTMRTVAGDLRSHVQTLFETPMPEDAARGFELTELLLSRMDSVVSADGGRLVVVLLPVMMQLSDSAFARFAGTFVGAPAGVDSEQPQRLMRGIAERQRLPLIDLLPAFRAWTTGGGESLYLEWDGHWNARGHRLASDVISRALLDGGFIP